MPFNLETILPHVEAYVVVVDRNHQIIYRNRAASNDTQISDPVLLASVDGAFSRKEGFKAIEMKAAVPELSGSVDELDLLVAGDYAVIGVTEYVILTVTDISQIRNEADSLASSLEKAEHEALSRSSYLANMSHEIRTPVNAITGFSRLLATTDDPAKKAKYVELIETNNSLLLQLIDDVLDIAKMDQGTLKFQTKEVDLNELMQSMDSTVRLRVQPRTVLNYVLGAADCRIDTDPERLSQVMLNLLTNACKFTPRGSITFGYELREESVYFFVKDTGMGIAADKQRLLFQRFSKQNDDKPGTGLGLAICKEIIDTFHGEIGVESAGEGKGSLFWFTLPVKPKEPEPSASYAPQMASPATSSQEVKAGRPTILVAEDNESNYFLLSSILEDDYNLMHAWDGREAVAMFAEKEPDLILMDINMPYMDGYEATRRIRQTSATVPVIAVTAYAFSSDKTRIMENGFNSYVSKPVNADRLISEIKRCLKH